MSRRPARLPSRIVTLLRQCQGLIDVGTARAVGIPPDHLNRLARAQLLIRLAEGVYASAEAVRHLDNWALHELTARAFLLSCSPDAFLTGWSAAAVWGLPTLGPPPTKPTVVRPKQVGRGAKSGAYGIVHTASIPPHHQHRLMRTRLVSRGWTAATIALTASVSAALVVADAALRAGGDVSAAVQHMSGWPGVTRARWVAAYADPLSESPIETLGRFASIVGGLPMPVSNAWVGDGCPEFRVDGLWPYHHAVSEADGASKYNNRPDAAGIVFKQNEREWRLRRLGLDIARYGFPLAAFRQHELISRFAQLLRDNPPRSEPVRWWKHVPGIGPVEPAPADWPSPHPTGILLPPGWWRDKR
jgi:hypothetical protein